MRGFRWMRCAWVDRYVTLSVSPGRSRQPLRPPERQPTTAHGSTGSGRLRARSARAVDLCQVLLFAWCAWGGTGITGGGTDKQLLSIGECKNAAVGSVGSIL